MKSPNPIVVLSLLLLQLLVGVSGFTATINGNIHMKNGSSSSRRRPSSSSFSTRPQLSPLSPSRTVPNLAAKATAVATIPDGIIKSVSVRGDENRPVRLGDIASVKYTCYLAVPTEHEDVPTTNGISPESTEYSMTTTLPLARSSNQKFVIGDGTMIEGWEKAIRTMCVGERSIVRVTDPNLSYGASGFPPLIPPNAIIEMDIEIIDSVPANANIDFDSLASKADNTPRTAKEIADAFEDRKRIRNEENAGKEELEGLDAFLAKVKNFYFYGLFEGETGERPPWFLRPSITFPLAFAIVGLAFYISLAGGAVSERGAQTKDELDEIILSSTMSSSYSSVSTSTAVLMSLFSLVVSASTWPTICP